MPEHLKNTPNSEEFAEYLSDFIAKKERENQNNRLKKLFVSFFTGEAE